MQDRKACRIASLAGSLRSQYRFARRTTALAALLVLVLAGCPGKPKPKAAAKPGSPDFTLTALDGSKVTLSALKGKPVLIDFWASWCGPCRKEIPELVKLYSQFNSRGVTFLGVGVDDTPDSLSKVQKDDSIPYPILLGTNDVAKAYQVAGIPMLVLLDKEGQIAYHEVGFEPDSGLAALERALNNVTGGKGVRQ